MPKVGNFPILLDFNLTNWIKTILLNLVQFVNPFGRSLTDVDMMKITWPTYEVHTYYDTGRSNTYRGKTYKEYSPLISYGHYLSHEGVFFGYAHKMVGLSRNLQPVGTAGHTYKVTVPAEGKVRVTSAVATEDVPALFVPPGDRTCQLWPRLCQE